MNQSDIDLLDLPNEILLIILKKLDNTDVLYSLFGINNKRLNNLIKDDVFTNILNLERTSSITDMKLDRFCTSILPQIHYSIKKLVFESTFMERILLVGNYPNLNSLELFNFGQETVTRYFIDDSALRHIFKYQITDLILHNNDEYSIKTELKAYVTTVYAHIMFLFQNLKHLTIVPSSVGEYPPLSIYNLPSTIYFSSTLTILCINLLYFDDCLLLLDGRLKQLTTFIVQIQDIFGSSFITDNMDELQNLKCFSLISYNITYGYQGLVLPLLRRMIHLEKLTLYLRVRPESKFIEDTNLFINETHIQNFILVHMPQLHTFNFYISTEIVSHDLISRKSNDNIEKTFTNIKHGQTVCIIDHCGVAEAICHVYSFPFPFTRLEKITTHFPNILFDAVTYLLAFDIAPMRPEFFMRISQAFPMLKYLIIQNRIVQSWNRNELKTDKNPLDTIIEYSHLITLDLLDAYTDYVLQFLLETRTYLPHLTELKVKYDDLGFVTKNFTRDATRRNCSKVKRLIFRQGLYCLKDVYQYFPSLEI